MENNEKDKSVKNNILSAIESGKIMMRPRWHFVLRAALFLLGTILVALTLLYLSSFIFFSLHQSGAWFFPRLGFRGLGLFFISLPWLLILVGIIFIIVLEVLVKKYSFSYRKPLLYSTIGIIIFVLLGGFVIAKTSLHPGLFENARNNQLPFGGGLYRQFGNQRPPGNVALGTVIEIIGKGYKIEDPRGETVEVIINTETQFPAGRNIAVDDNVIVLGQRQNSNITASVIRKIEENDFPRPPNFIRSIRPPR